MTLNGKYCLIHKKLIITQFYKAVLNIHSCNEHTLNAYYVPGNVR